MGLKHADDGSALRAARTIGRHVQYTVRTARGARFSPEALECARRWLLFFSRRSRDPSQPRVLIYERRERIQRITPALTWLSPLGRLRALAHTNAGTMEHDSERRADAGREPAYDTTLQQIAALLELQMHVHGPVEPARPT